MAQPLRDPVASATPATATPLKALAETVAAAARALEAPLEAIKRALPALEPTPRASDPATQRHTLRAIGAEADAVGAALGALGDLCALQAGTAALALASVEIGDVLMELMARWNARAPGHIFELALPGELPSVIGDERRIGWAIETAITYAVALAPEGGVIRVSARPRLDGVLVSVHHTGRAAPPEALERLFAPFYHCPGLEDVVVGGGLGLPLARAIVAAHGGRLWAETSPEDPGMALRMRLPLVPTGGASAGEIAAAAARDDEPAAPAAGHAPDRLALQRPRRVVLVGEADARMARYLRANLEAERYRALVAGERGELARLLELEEPDVVLLAPDLPGLGGLDGLSRLRAETPAALIVLAGRADPLECARALDLGASDYVAKPFGMEELLARIRAALRVAAATPATPRDEVFASGGLLVDVARRAVTMDGRAIALSKTEFKLLRALAQHVGMVLSHDVLLERVWGSACDHEVAFLWVYIRRLRRKIEPDPARPRYILTVPGVGYRLARQ